MLPPEQLEEERQRLVAARNQKAARRRRVVLSMMVILLAASLGIGVAYLKIRHTIQDNDELLDDMFFLAPDERRVNVLLIGVDTREDDAGRSDTLMLVSFDPASGVVDVMSIPRDTRVSIPGRRGHDRVNAAFAIGGADLTVRTVTELLGVRIDYYVALDFLTFEKIVDTLGGVMIEVPKRMYYVDRAQELIIDLQPGKQRLDGKRALGYVRFRHDRLGDVSLVNAASGQYDGRVERQLQFVRALGKQAMRPINLLRMPSLMRYVYSSVDTDIPVGRAVSLALAARRVSTNSLHTHVLPGVGQTLRGVSYWVPDLAETRKMVGSMTSAGEMRHVTVAVLNGSGVAGAAGQTAKRLRDLGHEVVSVGNADRFDYEQTQVVAVSGDLDAADMIAKVLGTKAAKKPQGTVADNAEVTVIVGRDLSSALVKGDYQTRR